VTLVSMTTLPSRVIALGSPAGGAPQTATRDTRSSVASRCDTCSLLNPIISSG